MLISERNKKTIDACRFCWMCRHICPIGNATGQERNNARGRALTLSLVERGTPLSVDIMENVYECALCGACTKECATGFDPVEFTKAVRLEGAQNGVTPSHISKLIDNLINFGNPYGAAELADGLADDIAKVQKDSKTLLFLGTDARFKCGAADAIRALDGTNFTVLHDEPSSGYMHDTLFGKAEETVDVMRKTAEILNQYETVIAYDPADAKIFLREYKEWGIELTANVKTFTSHLAEIVKANPPKKSAKTLTFQDPCHLARDLEETSPAREILAAVANVKEMLLCGKHTMWAGSLLMHEYMPKVVEEAAKMRWKNAIATGADILVTASPSEHAVLQMTKPCGMELLSLEQAAGGIL